MNKLMRKLNLDGEDLRHYGKISVILGVCLMLISVVIGTVGYAYFHALHHAVR